MAAPPFHNPELHSLQIESGSRRSQVEAVARALDCHGTLTLTPLASGLYPASAGASQASGYRSVWVRDNVFVALALLETDRLEAAVRVRDALTTFFLAYRHRFDAFIDRRVARADARSRPNVRFDGERLAEIDVHWAHAQNDALGYCLWLIARIAKAHGGGLDERQLELVTLLIGFFEAIAFWDDEDSGHWEETRKVSASSIGVIVGALRELRDVLQMTVRTTQADPAAIGVRTTALLERGTRALSSILPAECVQLSPRQNRRYDAALTFLAYPLAVLDEAMEQLVVDDVRRYLAGPIGIRRYLRDSYWAPDYDRLSEEDRTRDYSNDIEARDALLEDVGLEAQWCIFDPALSACFGRRYAATGAARDRELQLLHFNRSLAQITPEWTCPELYYLSGGSWVPNPHTPLLWTQAMLLLALKELRSTTPE